MFKRMFLFANFENRLVLTSTKTYVSPSLQIRSISPMLHFQFLTSSLKFFAFKYFQAISSPSLPSSIVRNSDVFFNAAECFSVNDAWTELCDLCEVISCWVPHVLFKPINGVNRSHFFHVLITIDLC